MKKFFLILTLLFIASVCYAANQLFNTEIQDADKKTAMDAIVQYMQDKGFTILTVNDYQLAFRKDARGLAKFLLGSKFNSTPEERIYFNIAQIGQSIKITLEGKMVVNPNSGFEKPTSLHLPVYQTYLDDIKAKFNGCTKFGITVSDKKKDDCFEIADVMKNSSAAKEGLIKGDLILKINDTKVSTMSYKKFNSYLDEEQEGGSIKLLVRTQEGDEKEVTVTKTFIPGEFQKLKRKI
jgi:predicted metalloprotease with PDZ domain